MSADEIAQAKALIRAMQLPIRAVPTRRFRPDPRGWRVDLRQTLRRSLHGGGAMIDLAKKRRIRRHPPLVILCDISGSMERYSRMLLHFMHALTNDRDRVHSLRVRHADHQRHAPAAPARRRPRAREGRRRRRGLVGRHPDRPLPARVQPRLVAPRARPGRGRAPDHRRPRSRRRRGPRARDGAPAQELPAPDLAEPAAALGGLRARSPPARARSSATSTTSARSTTSRASPSSPPPLPASAPAARKASPPGRAWRRSAPRRRHTPDWRVAAVDRRCRAHRATIAGFVWFFMPPGFV